MNVLYLLSECGAILGQSIIILTAIKKQYGYGKTNSEKELTDKIEKMYQEMVMPSINNGLAVVFILKYLILKTKSMVYILMIGKSVKSISKE